MGQFVELAARTNFSFLRGGSSPKVLVEHASQLGYDAIGIADCDGLYGMVRALEAAEPLGLRLVVGCEVSLDGASAASLWLHVATHEGYSNLCRLLTESHERHPKGRGHLPAQDAPRNQFAGVTLDRVCALAEGLWCLLPPARLEDVALLKQAFEGRLSLAVWRHLDGEDGVRISRVIDVSLSCSVPLCATNRVLYARRGDKRTLDVLHCIREGTTLDQAGRALFPNAEARLKSEAEVERLFPEHPEWLERTRVVADSCRFSLRELKYRFPFEVKPSGATRETADEALARLTSDGVRARYPGGAPRGVRAQIDKEL